MFFCVLKPQYIMFSFSGLICMPAFSYLSNFCSSIYRAILRLCDLVCIFGTNLFCNKWYNVNIYLSYTPKHNQERNCSVLFPNVLNFLRHQSSFFSKDISTYVLSKNAATHGAITPNSLMTTKFYNFLLFSVFIHVYFAYLLYY